MATIALVGGLYFAYTRFQPVPQVSSRRPEDSSHLKAQVKFGNVGIGPMYVQSLHIKDKDGNTVDPAIAFQPEPSSKFAVCGVAKDVFGDHAESPPVWPSGKLGFTSLVTVCARTDADGTDDAFRTDFSRLMKKRGYKIVVKSTCSDRGLLGLLSRTHTLPFPHWED